MRKGRLFLLSAICLVVFGYFAFSACSDNRAEPPAKAVITEISVIGGQRIFEVNESFSAGGLTVRARLSDGTECELAEEEYAIDSSAYRSTEAGKYYPIAVALKEDSSIKTEYQVKTRGDTIKILSIGNSFSEDAHAYLFNIIDRMGRYRNIVVGNLYIGGASFDLHLTHLKDTNASAMPYVYKKFTTDGYSTANRNALDIVREDDWDFITVQQVSQDCGKSNTLPLNQLQETESIIRRNATNEDVQIFWHATWAYQADSQHAGFEYYDRDQLTMYDAIVDVLRNTVLASGCFDGVIPNTTSIQNARTVFGDILTRDGYHLAVKGKFIAGLMFYKALSLEDVSGIIDVPMADIVGAGIAHEFDQPFLQAAIECVNSAFDYPFEITAITQE